MKTENIIWTIVIVFAALFLLSTFSGVGRGYGMMSGGTMGYGYGSMMAFGWIFSILIAIVLVLLIIWLWKQIESKDTKRKRQ